MDKTERKSTSFRLPVDLIERMKAQAQRENRSFSNAVENALLVYLEEMEGKS